MIKGERMNFIIEFLISQMNHWMLFPVVMAVHGISTLYSKSMDAGQPDFLMWTLCGLFPIAFFLVRYYVGNLLLFILCHAAIAACSLVLPVSCGTVGRVLCVLCAGVYVIYSLMLRLKEEAEIYSSALHPAVALVVSMASNFLLQQQEGAPDWNRYYLFPLIVVFACYLIIYYLQHYLNFLRVNASSAGYMPAGEILHSGIGFVLLYTLIGGLILVLSLNVEWLEPIIHVLKIGVMALLRFIFGGLSGKNGEELPEMTDAGYTPEAQADFRIPSETFWLWEALEPVIFVLFLAACAFGLVKAIILSVKLLRERFGNRADSNIISVAGDAVCDVREKCGVTKKVSGEKHAGFFKHFTPGERIRRMYKRRVLSEKTEESREVLSCMTARECGERLSVPGMAEVYERARYSDREITSEDVKQMRNLCGVK